MACSGLAGHAAVLPIPLPVQRGATMICISAKNFIDGGWREAADCFDRFNPADDRELVGTAPRSTQADVDRAVGAASTAYAKWRTLTSAKRAEPIDNLAQVMKRYGREIAKYITLETGKPLAEASAEVQESIALAQYFTGLARSPHGLIVDGATPGDENQIVRRPRGVVACITPGFAPLAISLRYILPSLLVGDTVVWKPSDNAVAAAQWLSRLFLESGFLEGAVNIVYGAGETVGRALVAHPSVTGVLFGGCRSTALELRRAVSDDPSKFLCADTHGVSGLIVLPDADLDCAASAAVKSAFQTSGQRWNSVDRLYVHEEVLEAFTELFVGKVAGLTAGSGLLPGVDIGPMSTREDMERGLAQRDRAKACAEKVLYDPGEPAGEAFEHGYFVSPFVCCGGETNQLEEARCPVVAVVPVDSLEGALAAYNSLSARSALSVFTRSYDLWRKARDEADFGQGYVNLPTTGGQWPSAGANSLQDILDTVSSRKQLTIA
jgi:aldehyde dehydrogenase (NAD+)